MVVETNGGGLSALKQLDSSRIYHGVRVGTGERPYQLFIHARNETGHTVFMCGGSLIYRKWILTAAHCVTELELVPIQVYNNFVILGGSVDLQNEQRIQTKKIRGRRERFVFVHPQWTWTHWEGNGKDIDKHAEFEIVASLKFSIFRIIVTFLDN